MSLVHFCGVSFLIDLYKLKTFLFKRAFSQHLVNLHMFEQFFVHIFISALVFVLNFSYLRTFDFGGI